MLSLKLPAKVFVNSADESLYFDQVPVAHITGDEAVDVIISMHETKVDDSVHDLTIQQRKCIFKNEVKLPHFPDEPYSFTNCMKDCRIQQALELCDCLPPFHRSNSMRNATFCDVERLKCLKDEKLLDISKCKRCELSCDFVMFSVENVQIE